MATSEKIQIEQLLVCATLTGSRAFGVATDESDWDYLVEARDIERYLRCDLLHKVGKVKYYPGQEFFYNFKVELHGNIINILSPRNFTGWISATENIKKFPRRCYENKEQRVRLFTYLCDVGWNPSGRIFLSDFERPVPPPVPPQAQVFNADMYIMPTAGHNFTF